MTEWVRISAFGKLAEICSQYLKKGSQVYVEGSLRTRKWTDKDGQERYTTEIRCDDMKMLGSRQVHGRAGRWWWRWRLRRTDRLRAGAAEEQAEAFLRRSRRRHSVLRLAGSRESAAFPVIHPNHSAAKVSA